jgi:hypothetical protein
MVISISIIHHEFVPKYDRWHGKLFPRIIAWFEHIGEVVVLFLKGDKPPIVSQQTLHRVWGKMEENRKQLKLGEGRQDI